MILIASVDFETYYDSNCNIQKLGNYAYCQHPEWEAILVAVHSEDLSWVGHPKDAPWEEIAKYDIILAHNAGFDLTVLERLVELGQVPDYMLNKNWVCTADLASYLGAPRNLAGAAKQLLGMDLDKGVRSDMKGKKAADMVD